MRYTMVTPSSKLPTCEACRLTHDSTRCAGGKCTWCGPVEAKIPKSKRLGPNGQLSIKGLRVNGVEIRKKQSRNRLFILCRDGFKCLKCGSKENLTIDHIIPKSKGGRDSTSNYQTLCLKCNGEKADTYANYITGDGIVDSITVLGGVKDHQCQICAHNYDVRPHKIHGHGEYNLCSCCRIDFSA